MAPIDALTGTTGAAGAASGASAVAPGSSAGEGFGDSLNRLLQSVEHTGAEANTAVGNMLAGSGDVHDAMIALQRADVTLQLTVQIRNKLVQAYQEIMRMPV